MTTSSTSSLLSANSPTTNLSLATTTNLPPANSMTTNLPPAISTTSHLLLATSTTSHLPLATSSISHLLPSTSTARACNINEADLFVVPFIGEENLLIEAEIEELDDVTMNEDVGANVILEPVPNPHSQKTGDMIEDIYAIKNPKQNLVNNPQKASNKDGQRGERRKSGREIAMKAKAKRAQKCGYCADKTNKHTKTACPLNLKYIAKLARIKAAAEQERRTAASATEQEERNSDTTHIADKEQSNTAS
nr:hypothetical protein [Tanacetum cinerariifolium]